MKKTNPISDESVDTLLYNAIDATRAMKRAMAKSYFFGRLFFNKCPANTVKRFNFNDLYMTKDAYEDIKRWNYEDE